MQLSRGIFAGSNCSGKMSGLIAQGKWPHTLEYGDTHIERQATAQCRDSEPCGLWEFAQGAGRAVTTCIGSAGPPSGGGVQGPGSAERGAWQYGTSACKQGADLGA